MLFEVSREKLKLVIQSAIKRELNNLKKSAEEGEVPDDISPSTIEDVHTIESIKVTDIDSLTDKISNQEVYFCNLFVTYDSVTGIALDDILYDIRERVKKMLGIKLSFDNFDTHNKYNDYGQM